MAFPIIVCASLALSYQYLADGQMPEQLMVRSLHSMMPDGTEGSTGESFITPEEVNAQFEEVQRAHVKDFSEWEHIEVDDEGEATLRTVSSKAPKWDYANMEKIRGVPACRDLGIKLSKSEIAQQQFSEARAKLRKDLGVDRKNVR